MSSPLLTYSRLATLRQCPRKHHLRYEVGLARDVIADYFRLGQAFHRGLEQHHAGQEPDVAIGEATQSYAFVPPSVAPYDWDIEHETVTQLLAGHFWRYEHDDLEIVAAEQCFRVPLRKASIRLRVKEWCDHVLFVGYDVDVADGKAKGSGTAMVYPKELPHFMAKSRTLVKSIPLEKCFTDLWPQLLV